MNNCQFADDKRVSPISKGTYVGAGVSRFAIWFVYRRVCTLLIHECCCVEPRESGDENKQSDLLKLLYNAADKGITYKTTTD